MGRELRQLRESSGMTIEDAGKAIGRSDSTISRIETGGRAIQLIELKGLLEAYDVDPEQGEFLIRLLREAPDEGWWTDYEDTMPPTLGTYIGLEADAATLRTFSLGTVHSLLRIESYVQALLRADRPSAPESEIAKLTAFHMQRQAVLQRQPTPLELVAILDEAALRRHVGGRDVLRAQLRHLVHCATEVPNITIQVLPFDKGAHGSHTGSWTILDFPDPAEPPVVYVDSRGGNLYLQKPHDRRRFDQLHGRLRGAALDEADSTRFLRTALEEL
jgi:transcriptional regulator with XRE-family HTH domain